MSIENPSFEEAPSEPQESLGEYVPSWEKGRYAARSTEDLQAEVERRRTLQDGTIDSERNDESRPIQELERELADRQNANQETDTRPRHPEGSMMARMEANRRRRAEGGEDRPTA